MYPLFENTIGICYILEIKHLKKGQVYMYM